MKKVILCDFDGTITVQDTLVEILDAFVGRQAWMDIEKRIYSGETGSRIALKEEFGLLDPKNATKDNIVNLLKGRIEIDPYFKEFLGFCEKNGFEFVIVSGGFSICIDTVLDKYGLSGLAYYSNKLLFTKNGLEIEYPYLSKDCDTCGNCKTMHLNRYKKAGYYIIYAGDSTTDKCPVKYADLVFAKSRLVAYCAEQNVRYTAYETFRDIQECLTQPHTDVWGIDTAGGSLQSHNDGDCYE